MEISIHRALAELKMLDKRINKAIMQGTYVAMQIGDEAPRGYKSKEEFNKEAKASYDSVQDLIKRRNAIKAAVVASNAVTKVNVAGVEMTVAEAIDRKDAIDYERGFLNQLRRQLNAVNNEIEMERQTMEHRLDKRIEADLGSKDRKDNAEEVENITKQFLKRYKPAMVDPVSIKEEIDKLTTAIEEFEMEVDFVLSESNTSTTIEVE